MSNNDQNLASQKTEAVQRATNLAIAAIVIGITAAVAIPVASVLGWLDSWATIPRVILLMIAVGVCALTAVRLAEFLHWAGVLLRHVGALLKLRTAKQSR